MIEAAHYQLQRPQKTDGPATPATQSQEERESRTISLIDNFLESLPQEANEQQTEKKRKPTPADAAVDYVAYLLDIEDELNQEPSAEPAPEMKGQDLIDNFIENEGGKIQLKDEIDFTPEVQMLTDGDENDDDDGYFTETLAKIYIKQGRYSKALEIIQRLNLNYPKKNAYFADQIRFLEKLILNNKQNNKQK
jgi:predicted Zn-dependent protease